MTTKEGIQRAAERASGHAATLVETVPVVETFRGEIVWEGVVSVFDTPRCKVYGWAVKSDKGPQFVAVLNEPPVDSTITAVRAWIVSQARK